MYNLDTTYARKSEFSRITEKGAYTGKFTSVYEVTAKSGTKGITFHFMSDDGESCTLSIYTEKSDGTKIFGYNMLMALMTCMQLRTLTGETGEVEMWVDGNKVPAKTTVFQELMDKPIGLVLNTEEFETRSGESRTRMVIYGVYQAATRLIASEILDRQTVPEKLDKVIQSLNKKQTKKASSSLPPTYSYAAQAQATGNMHDMNDDIPW